MRGKVTCRFIGGPQGEETITLAAMACGDRVALASEAWIAVSPNGQPAIVKGPRGPRAPWLAYTQNVYEKVKPVEPGNVTYRFLRSEEVVRCEKILEDKNRRCRNRAEPGAQFCRAHAAAL